MANKLLFAHTSDGVFGSNVLQRSLLPLSIYFVYHHQSERGEQRAGELPDASFVADPQAIFDDLVITLTVACTKTNRHCDLVVRAAQVGKHTF